MPNDPAASYAALRAPLPPRNEIIAQSLYWYPNELAVTVHAEKMPTLPQLRDLSARLHRLLSRVGISIVPFYSGGPVISRAGARESAKKQQAKPTKTTGRKAAAIEVGITPITIRVKASLYKQWTREVQECGSDGRFRGGFALRDGLGDTPVIRLVPPCQGCHLAFDFQVADIDGQITIQRDSILPPASIAGAHPCTQLIFLGIDAVLDKAAFAAVQLEVRRRLAHQRTGVQNPCAVRSS
jgi:hypothetical protein